jgi:LPS export ABC transporter protein LptC
VIALSALGSATLLFSCSNKTEATQYDYETLMTESSENRTITMMENGRRSYTFVTPLMEGYSMSTNPYQEFRRGISMTTYTQDSTNLVDATITANYAIYYENQKLWEAKGNVTIIKNNRKDGDTTVTNQTEIYTQQLFWNATTKKIYSNVDTKILQADGWHFGVGFDADEDLKNIHFRKYSSEMEFDMSQPTEEEIAENNKKHDKEGNKDSNKKGTDNKGADKKGTEKKDSDKKGSSDRTKRVDPTKNSGLNNGPKSNDGRAGSVNVSPTTRPNAKGDKSTGDDKSAKPSSGGKKNNTIRNAEITTSTEFNLDGGMGGNIDGTRIKSEPPKQRK